MILLLRAVDVSSAAAALRMSGHSSKKYCWICRLIFIETRGRRGWPLDQRSDEELSLRSPCQLRSARTLSCMVRLISDDLAQVSLPRFERGALLRQPFVLIVNFVDVAVGMGQHGKPIVARNPKACQSGRERASEIMRRRPIGLEVRHRLGVVAAIVEVLDDAAQRLRQTVPRQPRALRELGGEDKFRLGLRGWRRAAARSRRLTISRASGGSGTTWARRAFMRPGGNSQCAVRSLLR